MYFIENIVERNKCFENILIKCNKTKTRCMVEETVACYITNHTIKQNNTRHYRYNDIQPDGLCAPIKLVYPLTYPKHKFIFNLNDPEYIKYVANFDCYYPYQINDNKFISERMPLYRSCAGEWSYNYCNDNLHFFDN